MRRFDITDCLSILQLQVAFNSKTAKIDKNDFHLPIITSEYRDPHEIIRQGEKFKNFDKPCIKDSGNHSSQSSEVFCQL